MSLTISSLLAFVILRILDGAGIKLGEDKVNSFVQVAGSIITATGIWYGRFRKKDITWFGGRK